jgi:hypothetical protein
MAKPPQQLYVPTPAALAYQKATDKRSSLC